MDSIQQLADSIASLFWPVLVAVVIWRLYPTIQQLVSSRAFTVKVAGFEFTAQEATDKLVQSTAELQSRLAALDRPATSPQIAAQHPQDRNQSTDTRARPQAGHNPHSVLWVDDVPDRKAYELAQLEALGVRIDIARSTGTALDLMASRDFDAVVTGMARSEEGSYSPTAGLSLLEAANASGSSVPVYVFTASLAPLVIDEIEACGGRVATTSMQLFDALWAGGETQRQTADTGSE